jgi:F-type H+-transporting ATPase subunit gamma
MSGNLRHLVRRIESAEELLGVTRSMRGLAAVNLRHFELAVEAVGDYEAIVEDGLQIVLRNGGIDRLPLERPQVNAGTALVVFGSNQGLCGSINRQVAARAANEALGVASLVHVGAVGDRLAAELDLLELTPTLRWDLPGSVEGISRRALQVLDQTRSWRDDENISRILLVFPRFLGRHRAPDPVTLQLTPTDRDWLEWLAIRRWESRVLPTFSMPWDVLTADLIEQALFVRLHRSFAQTMASVSASRLAAMDAAQRNIEERRTGLSKQYQHLRHAQITEELLDVVSGFESLSGH